MGRKKYRRIEAVYNGKGGTQVTEYKVVDENGNIEFQGTYSECYYVMFPDAVKGTGWIRMHTMKHGITPAKVTK